MKRAVSLQSLSREHHQGLMISLLLEKGHTKNADPAILRDFVHMNWEEDLKIHFDKEENILLPALATTAFDPELIDRLILEHSGLRNLASKIIAGEGNPEDIRQFAIDLEKHIRFEERIFFPAVELALSEKHMKELGVALGEENTSHCMNYPVKFWE